MFIVLEGVDGSGKSTQLRLFSGWLRDVGCDVVDCRDPGSTALGEAVRALLLDDDQPLQILRRSEMLLYMAARAQMVDELIRPVLAAGKTVLSDRYLLSNIVYQGYAGGLDVEEIRRVGLVATGGLEPDLTIVLDMPPSEAGRRISRDRDRMERQGAEFDEAVRAGYLREAARAPGKIVVVNAAQSIDEVQTELRSAISRFLPARIGRTKAP